MLRCVHGYNYNGRPCKLGDERNKDMRRQMNREKWEGQWMVFPLESKDCRSRGSRNSELER